jgi:hypothetical protein
MTKNIVIVGGGFAGIGVANALEKALAKSNDQEHRIILIEKVFYIACLYFNYDTKDTLYFRNLIFTMLLLVSDLLLSIGILRF